VNKTVLAGAFFVLAASCASQPEKPSKYPPQKEGCEVQVFQETPATQTDNIGPVSSSCDPQVSDQDCLRTLKDEVCKLGGNVVWGVEPNPTMHLGKKKFSGRAAHTK
jgi:hypothetical protein